MIYPKTGYESYSIERLFMCYQFENDRIDKADAAQTKRLMSEGKLQPTGRILTFETRDGDVIKLPEAEPLHTFAMWKSLGYRVKKGEHAIYGNHRIHQKGGNHIDHRLYCLPILCCLCTNNRIVGISQYPIPRIVKPLPIDSKKSGLPDLLLPGMFFFRLARFNVLHQVFCSDNGQRHKRPGSVIHIGLQRQIRIDTTRPNSILALLVLCLHAARTCLSDRERVERLAPIPYLLHARRNPPDQAPLTVYLEVVCATCSIKHLTHRVFFALYRHKLAAQQLLHYRLYRIDIRHAFTHVSFNGFIYSHSHSLSPPLYRHRKGAGRNGRTRAPAMHSRSMPPSETHSQRPKRRKTRICVPSRHQGIAPIGLL